MICSTCKHRKNNKEFDLFNIDTILQCFNKIECNLGTEPIDFKTCNLYLEDKRSYDD